MDWERAEATMNSSRASVRGYGDQSRAHRAGARALVPASNWGGVGTRERGEKRERDVAHPVVDLREFSGVEGRWRSGGFTSSLSSGGALMAAALGFAGEGGASSKGSKAGSAAP